MSKDSRPAESGTVAAASPRPAVRVRASRAASALVVTTLAALLVGLWSLQLFVGYADNGDFDRSMGFALAKPSGFHSMWERHEGGGTADRFQTVWHDRWDVRAEFEPIEGKYPRSTYKAYLITQVGFVALLTGGDVYSVVLGSLPSRALLLLALCGLTFAVAAATSRAVALAFLAIAMVVLLDATFAGLVNSFYEEQMTVLLLPLLAWAVLTLLHRPRLAPAGVALLLAALLGGAKTAYFYLPALLLPLLLALQPGWRARAVLFLIFLPGQWLAVQPLLTSEYPNTNAYHAMYYGALLELPRERLQSLKAAGEEFDENCIGAPAFVPAGTACRDQAMLTHRDTLSLLLRHPDLALRMVIRAAALGSRLRPDYLSQRLHDAPDLSTLAPFRMMQVAFSWYFHVFVAAAALAASVLLIRRRAGTFAPVLATGVALAVYGATQYAVALADGYYEMVKHLLAANFALALASAFLLPGLVFALARRRPGAAPAPNPLR